MKICIVGASGLVGRFLIKILEKSLYDIDLVLFASSDKEKILFKNKYYEIKKIDLNLIDKYDITFFATNKDVSKKFIPYFIEKGNKVIDNSSYFRDDYKLIIPSINGSILNQNDLLICSPNCSVIQSCICLKDINDLFKIEEINYNTYQAVSGSGYKGLMDLNLNINYYKDGINNNIIPYIDELKSNNYTYEELKMIKETNKIFNSNFLITATCVRVPVEYYHGVSIYCRTKYNINLELLLNKYNANNLIKVYPKYFSLKECLKFNDNLVHIGRIRKSLSKENIINLFCFSNNLIVGASKNCFDIFEYLVRSNLL